MFRKNEPSWKGDIQATVPDHPTPTEKRCYCDYADVDEKGEFHLKYLDGYYAENQA